MSLEQLMQAAQVNNRYTGDCRGCGECCGRLLPLSEKDIKRIKDYVSAHDIKKNESSGFTCPYLTEEKACAIYPARPDICRAYRCDFQVKGYTEPVRLLMREAKYDLVDMGEI